MYDVVIIGAGVSGLAAGIRLAHFGKRVAIVERQDRVGGLNTWYERGGRSFDVGLHALTNWPADERGGWGRSPLTRALRQLRIDRQHLELTPQAYSEIVFPGCTLRFGNGPELLEEEVARRFPGQSAGFHRLIGALPEYEQFAQEGNMQSARAQLARWIDEPLLREMLLCPVFFYGGAWENDMPWGVFAVLFRSIFLEGLCRPRRGIRPLLDSLTDRFQQAGGELLLGCRGREIRCCGSGAEKLVLAGGREMVAEWFLSCAGWPETHRLLCPAAASQAGKDPACLPQAWPTADQGLGGREAGAEQRLAPGPPAGPISIVELLLVLSRPVRQLGLEATMLFVNREERFAYRRPDDAVDLQSLVICAPDNFQFSTPTNENLLRITALANYDRWAGLEADRYRAEKAGWTDRLIAVATKYVPGLPEAVVDTEMITPWTIYRYTGRPGGAVYGSPEKRYDGTTPWRNLHLCGTDQGLVGIVGAMTSGIQAAARYLLER